MSQRQKILEVATSIANEAGAYLLSQRNSRLQPDEKTRNDFVTHVDRTSEQIILKQILKHFPDHSIMAEEGSGEQTGSSFEWFIDPLDGTRNFIQRIPFYCVSIGVYFEGKPFVGVVYNPEQNELFTAAAGNGAMLNGEPIKCSHVGLDRALMATGFPHQRKDVLSAYMAAFQTIFDECAGVRRLGSAALDLCYVACGRMDGYWELGLHPWDIAAGMLIASEAGATVTDFHGKNNSLKNGCVIATSKEPHNQLTNILSKHFPRENHE
ncbi:MAG: inositol monophosphatase family protein [Calditrichia bacterium]